MTHLVVNKFKTVWNPTLPLRVHSWKCIWIYILQNSGHFVQGGWVKYTPRPTYIRAWLARTRLLYVARGRGGILLNTTEYTVLRYVITLVTPDTHRPSYAIEMVADVLASNRRQAISNHHANLITVILRVTDIISHPLNKQCSREVKRSATRQFLFCFFIGGFALWQR